MAYTTDYDGQKKSQIWDSKYGRESQGTRTGEWLRWLGPEAIVNDRPVLSSERAPHINKPATVQRIPYSVFCTAIKNLVISPDGYFIPRQTGRLTIGRNIRLRLTEQLAGRFRSVNMWRCKVRMNTWKLREIEWKDWRVVIVNCVNV
jgi:hypothetical protein